MMYSMVVHDIVATLESLRYRVEDVGGQIYVYTSRPVRDIIDTLRLTQPIVAVDVWSNGHYHNVRMKNGQMLYIDRPRRRYNGECGYIRIEEPAKTFS